MAASTITLVVETASGLLIRHIPAASPLRDDLEPGLAAELATQDAAAVWGLPDFVFHPTVLALGSGSREIGDRLLLVGDVGVVVQIKARVTAGTDEAKERRWIDKHVAAGLRQAHGTIRRLQSAPARVTNGRGRTIDVDAGARRWLAVVVIDHARVPDEIIPPVEGHANPSVVMLRRDWEFLFDHLKSTYAVARYLERIAGEPSALGTEPVRYFQLAQADEKAPPGPLDPRLLQPDGRPISSPLLPLRPTASNDQPAHLLVRALFEDIAATAAGDVPETDRLRMLAAFDRLPVSVRGQIGRFLIDAIDATTRTPARHTEWRQRRVVIGPSAGEPPIQLAYAVCSLEHSAMVQDVFASLVRLRHYDVHEVVDEADSLISVGVLLTPRSDRVRPWDTTMIATAGDPKLDAEQLAVFREIWSR